MIKRENGDQEGRIVGDLRILLAGGREASDQEAERDQGRGCEHVAGTATPPGPPLRRGGATCWPQVALFVIKREESWEI